jgi:RNA polymerase sigma factor (sigma-70 family)
LEQAAIGQAEVVKAEKNEFLRLYDRYYDAIFRYCAHRIFDRDMAEDMTSRVFCKALEKFDKFKGNEKQFLGWVYRIANNEIVSMLRKEKTKAGALKNIALVKSAETDNNEEKLKTLRNAMLKLKPKYQEVVAMRYFEGLSSEQISEMLGKRAGTIRSRLKRAIDKLKELMVAEERQVNNER